MTHVFLEFLQFYLADHLQLATSLRQHVITPSSLTSGLHLGGYGTRNYLWHCTDPVPVGLGMEARTSDCSSAAESRSRYFHTRTLSHSIPIRRAVVRVYVLSSWVTLCSVAQWCVSMYCLPELHWVASRYDECLHTVLLSYWTTCVHTVYLKYWIAWCSVLLERRSLTQRRVHISAAYILNQFNPLHILMPYSFRMRFNIVLPSGPSSAHLSFHLLFSDSNVPFISSSFFVWFSATVL
jgi:hypothetical protein